MANQTNVIFNGTDAPVTVTLAAASVVVPARGKTGAVTGSDAEYTTIAATAGLAVLKSTTTAAQLTWIANAMKSQD